MQNQSLHQESVTFNVSQAKEHITLAGSTAEAFAKQFLLDHPVSSMFLASRSNQDMALRVIQTTLLLLDAFNENRSCSEQEKQKAYLNFLATMTDLAKAPGDFSRQLKEKQVMRAVYESIGKIIYNRPALADQIQPYAEAHVDFMKSAWSSPEVQLNLNRSL